MVYSPEARRKERWVVGAHANENRQEMDIFPLLEVMSKAPAE